MKTIYKYLFIFLLLSNYSCEPEINDIPKKNLLIFCDLSSSGLESIEKESNKIKKIIDSLDYNTRVRIYPMGLSIYQNSIVDHYIETKSNFNDDNDKILEKKKNLISEIDSVLISTYKNGKTKKETQLKSCIISSFEMAFNYLPDNDDELLKHSRVILLTDMIEQCPESSAGSIYMCSKTRQPNFEEIKKQIQEEYNPTSKLSDKIKTNQLFIVMTSNYGNQQKCLTEIQQNEIWDIVLQKQGFVEDYAKIIRKSTEVPSTEILWKQEND